MNGHHRLCPWETEDWRGNSRRCECKLIRQVLDLERGREYIVQINRYDAAKLSEFAVRPNGSLRLGQRLVVEAVEGGGLLVRTQGFRN